MLICIWFFVGKEPPVQIHDSEAKFKHITEMTILTVQLTVEFAKRLPGFDTLLREDQITLLKVKVNLIWLVPNLELHFVTHKIKRRSWIKLNRINANLI